MSPKRGVRGRMKATRAREKESGFTAFVFVPYGGGCTLGNPVVRWFYTPWLKVGHFLNFIQVPKCPLLQNIPSTWSGRSNDQDFHNVQGLLPLHIFLHCLLSLVAVGGSWAHVLRFLYRSWEGRCGRQGESSTEREWRGWRPCGRCVMVQGQDLLFLVIHLSPISFDSPLMFTISIMFFTNTFCYIVWWPVPPFLLFIFLDDEHLSPKTMTHHLIPHLLILPWHSSMSYNLVHAHIVEV